MAVVQISRIQHRSGVSDNLPQLARAEIGLAVDTRKVYIGNGGTDAPTTENIELLTTKSQLLQSAETYTYSGAQIGFSAQTGASSSVPIVRSIQTKLDDFASIRDFGAKGDGNTDDTVAINRALYELYIRESEQRIRRTLYFPAGNYIVSGIIKVPTFARLVGEGPFSTTITSSDSVGPVATTCDSKQQTGSGVGSNNGVIPQDIIIEGMTFASSTDIDTFVIDQTENIHFTNCAFVGPKTTAPSTVGNSKANIKITSSETYNSNYITLRNCTLRGQSLNFLADQNMQSILLDSCHFDISFKSIKIGEAISGSGVSSKGPEGVKVTGSVFDKSHNNAIHIFPNVEGFASSYNMFKDCANSGLGANNASSDVILFANDHSYSIGDNFERPDGDVSTTTRRIDHGTRNIVTEKEQLAVGSHIRRAQASLVIAGSQTATTTGLTFSDTGDFASVEVDYSIVRNSKLRQGKITVTHDATQQVIDDEFSENNGDVGVTFTLTNTSNVSTIKYTSDSQAAGTMFMSTRIIR